MIAAVVLAAGASTRMGRPKLLLPVAGRTVLAAVLEPLLACGLERVVVVLGAGAEQVRREAGLPADPRVEVVENADWSSGMSSSLRCGLEACAGAEAVLVVLGDRPGASAGLVGRVVAAGRQGAPLVVPVHAGRAGHPVLFGRGLWAELRGLSGDAGAREVVRRHWPEVVRVPGEALPDLDTEADYQALVEGRPPRPDEGMKLP